MTRLVQNRPHSSLVMLREAKTVKMIYQQKARKTWGNATHIKPWHKQKKEIDPNELNRGTNEATESTQQTKCSKWANDLIQRTKTSERTTEKNKTSKEPNWANWPNHGTKSIQRSKSWNKRRNQSTRRTKKRTVAQTDEPNHATKRPNEPNHGTNDPTIQIMEQRKQRTESITERKRTNGQYWLFIAQRVPLSSLRAYYSCVI